MPVETELALRRMVGVAVDASLAELRSAYDGAMHRATRSGDHQHALALSRAYDRLPPATRDALYPSSRTRAAVQVAPPPTWTRGRRRTRRAAGARRRRGHRPRLRPIVYGVIGTAVLVLAVLGAARHYEQRRPDREPTVHQPVADLPTAPTVVGPVRPVIVPTSAPTGANGLVTLLCEPAPGAGGYAMTAPRGAVVACRNGATPTVVG